MEQLLDKLGDPMKDDWIYLDANTGLRIYSNGKIAWLVNDGETVFELEAWDSVSNRYTAQFLTPLCSFYDLFSNLEGKVLEVYKDE